MCLDGLDSAALWDDWMTEKLGVLLRWRRFSLSLFQDYDKECQIDAGASLWVSSLLFSCLPLLILHEIMAPCIKFNSKFH